jgi:hypothetical protein
MKMIQLRPQRVSDARRFFQILRQPDFVDFPAKPKSVEEEKAFLQGRSSTMGSTKTHIVSQKRNEIARRFFQ